MNMFSEVMVVVPVLVNVAFITLLERKVLGYSQLRTGPNKVGWLGIPQPFNDAIKLFSKEVVKPGKGNLSMFVLGPCLGISISLLVWVSIGVWGFLSSVSLSMIFIYMVLSMNIYPLMMSGWSSNSNYASVGALRGIAKTVSYEVSFALIIMFFLLPGGSASLWSMVFSGQYWVKWFVFFPLAGLWLITSVAETNRTPFDFAEGESELVSGFNIEYGGVGFALIFMAEYASIYFMSSLFILVMVGGGFLSSILFVLISGVVFVWIWIRATLPRYRYDMLMNLAWLSYLPLVLLMLIYMVSVL